MVGCLQRWLLSTSSLPAHAQQRWYLCLHLFESRLVCVYFYQLNFQEGTWGQFQTLPGRAEAVLLPSLTPGRPPLNIHPSSLEA